MVHDSVCTSPKTKIGFVLQFIGLMRQAACTQALFLEKLKKKKIVALEHAVPAVALDLVL